jgi:outer membrane protein
MRPLDSKAKRSIGACTISQTIVVAAALLLLAARPAPADAASNDPGAVRLTAVQAVARALKHNLSLGVDRLAPALSDSAERKAAAAFEPGLYARVDASGSPGKVSTQRAGLAPTSTTAVGGQLGARKTFSTGTSVDLSLSSDALFGGGSLDPAYQSGAALTVRQSLLRGVSREANLAGVTDARLSREVAGRGLSRQAEQVALSTLEAYFNLQAALGSDEVATLAVQTSAAALAETRTLIAAGKLAGSEEVSARYALQIQRREQLKTTQAVGDARDTLARLIGLVGPGSLATPRIVTVAVATAALPQGSADLQRMLASALAGRGDYLAARQEIVRLQRKAGAARHGLLPSLDLVGSVYLSGLSGDSASAATSGAASSTLPAGYWSSYGMDRFGWSVGLVFELPLGNDSAKAELKGAELALRRAKLSADLVKQQIALELNQARRAARLAQDQLELTELAVEVAETKLKNQQALYRAGKSSGHDLATIRAQAVAERLARAEAAATLNKAVARLHASAGELLARMKLAFKA